MLFGVGKRCYGSDVVKIVRLENRVKLRVLLTYVSDSLVH